MTFGNQFAGLKEAKPQTKCDLLSMLETKISAKNVVEEQVILNRPHYSYC